MSLSEVFQGLDTQGVLQDLLGVGEIIDTGSELIHSCRLPFGMHKNGDSNPSAALNKEKLVFNCFTCGGGSIIWLVENVLNISRDRAIIELKKYASGADYVTPEKFLEKLTKLFSQPESRSLDIPIYNEKILKLWSGESDYLDKRGVSREVQQRMRTGIRRGRQELIKGVSGNYLATVDRVILPHFINGKLVGWVARRTEDTPGTVKYRNSKGFPRQYWLYNLDNVKGNESCIIVESPLSVLTLQSRGIDNVVSSFGAKVTKTQLECLRSFSSVTIFMDGDAPGRSATHNLVDSLREYTDLKVIETPDGEDPASLSELPYGLSSFEYQLSRT